MQVSKRTNPAGDQIITSPSVKGKAVKDRKGTSLGAKSTRRTDKEAETKAKADIAVT